MLSVIIYKGNGEKRVLARVSKTFLTDNCVEAIKLPQLTDEEIENKISALRPIILSGSTERNNIINWLENPVYNEITEGDLPALASEFLNSFLGEKEIQVKLNGEWYHLKGYSSFNKKLQAGDTSTLTAFTNEDCLRIGEVYFLKNRPYQYNLSGQDRFTIIYEGTLDGFVNYCEEERANFYSSITFEQGLIENIPLVILMEKEPSTSSSRILELIEANNWRGYTPVQKRKIFLKVINYDNTLERPIRNLTTILRQTEGNFEFDLVIGGIPIHYKWENRCLSSDKAICDRCGAIMDTEANSVLTAGDGSVICRSCAISGNFVRVNGYHNTAEFFHPMERGNGKASDRSLFGCEIEMIHKRGFTEEAFFTSPVADYCFGGGNRAKFERDGSLSSGGEEMITQPMSKSWILENMENWLKELGKLYRTDSSCGLHVHVDKNVLTGEQWDSIYQFLAKNYEELSDVDAIRHSKHYCDYRNITEAVENQPDSPHTYQRWNDHSCPINFLGNHGSAEGKTVEFRFFDGTLDPEKWMKNIKFVFTLLDLAEAGKLPNKKIRII